MYDSQKPTTWARRTTKGTLARNWSSVGHGPASGQSSAQGLSGVRGRHDSSRLSREVSSSTAQVGPEASAR
eukprot:11029696-Alexandrium_andersonii.AAC.1